MKKYSSVDRYIEDSHPKAQPILRKMRATIAKAAPKALETMSYGIPTFKLNGKNLVHFGGFKDHVSFFPTGSGVEAFKKELGKHAVSKGTVQYDFEEKIPYALITKIVKFRIKQVIERNK